MIKPLLDYGLSFANWRFKNGQNLLKSLKMQDLHEELDANFDTCTVVNIPFQSFLLDLVTMPQESQAYKM